MQTLIALDQEEIKKIIDKLDLICRRLDNIRKPEGKEWLTEEVCEMLGVGTKTMRGYRNKGELGFAKRGRKIYYKTDEVNKFIESKYMSGY